MKNMTLGGGDAAYGYWGVPTMKSVLARTILHAPRTGMVLGMLCGMSGAGLADNIYTFEAPQFTLGETTPLLNQAPNSGDPAFKTSFTSTGTYQITNLDNSGVIVGQALFAPITSAALQLTFSVPVISLSVDFAINDLNTSPPGELDLTTPSGDTRQFGSNVGGPFQGGTLIFNAATPFSSAVLQGFLARQVEIAREERSGKRAAGGPTKFTSEEHYTPVYDNNLADLQPLNVNVVSRVTEFYSYRKAMVDFLRRLAAEQDPEKKHEARNMMLYMQFLMCESAREAVKELIEFEPNLEESKINILCSELSLFSYLLEVYNENDFRGQRLRIRKYNAIVRETLAATAKGKGDKWERAVTTVEELKIRCSALSEKVIRPIPCRP
jgi:hypothetical protein